MEIGVNGPKLALEGLGGTYFLFDPRKRRLGKQGIYCLKHFKDVCLFLCF
jgi:hypothetical protein